jgi:hypothetical protein
MPHRGLCQAGARAGYIIPKERLMPFRWTFRLRQSLPDRHHMFGSLHRQFVK